MARITIDGIDQLMAGLNAQGSRLRPIIQAALEASADVLRERLLDEEAASFVDPSGELGETIAPGPVMHTASASMVDVYAQGEYIGRRGRSRSAGTVAAMVEYKHGNPWNRRARTKSKKEINTIIAEALSKS